MRDLNTIAATGFALTCFAANSLFCRLALGPRLIAPDTYTTIRIVSGAAALWLLTTITGKRAGSARLSIGLHRLSTIGGEGVSAWRGAGLLFIYAIAFSFAYVSLSVGTGALILFGSVQATMIVAGLRAGERPSAAAWFGIALAFSGLAYLVAPGLSAPSPMGSLLMCTAGIGWGLYSLQGKGKDRPLARTAANFERAVPMALVMTLFNQQGRSFEPRGALFAVLSGTVASGLGYIAWYAALRHLTSTGAAALQLSVPVLAAFAGVIFLGESVPQRLVVSSLLILGGIGLVLAARTRVRQENTIAIAESDEQ